LLEERKLSAIKNSKGLAANRQAQKRDKADFRAKPTDSAAAPELRARSIMKRFSKSIAHLAK